MSDLNLKGQLMQPSQASIATEEDITASTDSNQTGPYARMTLKNNTIK